MCPTHVRRARIVGHIVDIDGKRKITGAIDRDRDESCTFVHVVVRLAKRDQGICNREALHHIGGRVEVAVTCLRSSDRARAGVGNVNSVATQCALTTAQQS